MKPWNKYNKPLTLTWRLRRITYERPKKRSRTEPTIKSALIASRTFSRPTGVITSRYALWTASGKTRSSNAYSVKIWTRLPQVKKSPKTCVGLPTRGLTCMAKPPRRWLKLQLPSSGTVNQATSPGRRLISPCFVINNKRIYRRQRSRTSSLRLQMLAMRQIGSRRMLHLSQSRSKPTSPLCKYCHPEPLCQFCCAWR